MAKENNNNNSLFDNFEIGDRVIRVAINGSKGEPIGSFGTVTKVVLSGKCLHVQPDDGNTSYLYYSKDWEKTSILDERGFDLDMG